MVSIRYFPMERGIIVLLRIREGKALTGKWRLVFYESGFGGKQKYLVDL